jgi:proteic killer suppression protein
VIRSFKHKGLEKFFASGSTAGIQAHHAKKLRMQLTALHTSLTVDDMDLPGWRLHPLTGNKEGLWAVDVNKNWRVVFEFTDGHAYVVNYEDYH